ncbi:MAG: hypothetical protein J7M26_07675, partial [Armatimonadetes bacterium]|nr:hypothetical protein [Armatimonadota bacterium]
MSTRLAIFLALLTVLALCQAQAGETAAVFSAAADAGLARLDAKSHLLLDDQNRPEVARLTPAWALSCLIAGRHQQQATQALAAVAAQVQTEGEAAGLVPWFAGGRGSLGATEVAAPVLAAALLKHSDELGSVAPALKKALTAMGKSLHAATPADADVRTLAMAGACAGLGRALGESALTARANKLLVGWLKNVQAQGFQDAHGPTTEAYRLADLAWLRLFLDEPPPQLAQAWGLCWADTLQRLRQPGPSLAGAQLFSSPGDAATASGPLGALLSAAFGLKAPASSLPDVYFALPFRTPLADAPPALELPDTFTCSYCWGAQQRYRETVFVAPDLSLATMTGRINSTSAPLMLLLADRGSAPACYLRPSASCHVASLQRGPVALVNFDFDRVGWKPRTQLWAEMVFGPRPTIGQVAVLRRPWQGQPVAVDRLWPVAVETGEHYIGIIPLWAGSAEAQEATERVMPGVLQWSSTEDDALLTLRLYARQATYELRRPEDNYETGCLVVVRRTSEMSFADFCNELRHVRYKKTFEKR